jgi:hypothetical protein
MAEADKTRRAVGGNVGIIAGKSQLLQGTVRGNNSSWDFFGVIATDKHTATTTARNQQVPKMCGIINLIIGNAKSNCVRDGFTMPKRS